MPWILVPLPLWSAEASVSGSMGIGLGAPVALPKVMFPVSTIVWLFPTTVVSLTLEGKDVEGTRVACGVAGTWDGVGTSVKEIGRQHSGVNCCTARHRSDLIIYGARFSNA